MLKNFSYYNCFLTPLTSQSWSKRRAHNFLCGKQIAHKYFILLFIFANDSREKDHYLKLFGWVKICIWCASISLQQNTCHFWSKAVRSLVYVHCAHFDSRNVIELWIKIVILLYYPCHLLTSFISYEKSFFFMRPAKFLKDKHSKLIYI